MPSQVIARKWRPQSLEEVTGQDHVTNTIKNAIMYDRLHHSYIFSGARGIGKTTTARLLAKALNCHKHDSPSISFCRWDQDDSCDSCNEITKGLSMDVLEIDAAQNSGVENMRETIISQIGTSPARDRYKVFLIDECHGLSPASFNALLKSVEEPPKNVMFILATTEKHKIPDTILSRSQQFQFRTIPVNKIQARLRLIADAEGIDIPDNALREISRAGEGSMRDAQSSFDQVISFAGSTIKKIDVESALGFVGGDMLARVVKGISTHNPLEALAVVDDVVMRGFDLRMFCRDLLAHFRDLLVAKNVGPDDILLESAACDRAVLDSQSKLFSAEDLIRFFHNLAETESKLRTSTHPRYQLEIGLVKLMELNRISSFKSILDRISNIEAGVTTSVPVTPTIQPVINNDILSDEDE